MSRFDQREAPDRGSGALQNSGLRDREAQVNSNTPKRTQRQKVLDLLLEGWVCGSRFYAEYLPRATARIHELRQDGYVIPRRRCDNPDHQHQNPQWQWTVEAVPAKPDGAACEACGGVLAHVSSCQAQSLEMAEGQLPGIGDA